MTKKYLDIVRKRAEQRLLFLPHAVRQMNHPDGMISTSEVRKVIFEGEIIEDYPEDTRGHSWLMLRFGNEGRSLYVVCARKDQYLAIIAAYIPSEDEWDKDLRNRRKK